MKKQPPLTNGFYLSKGLPSDPTAAVAWCVESAGWLMHQLSAKADPAALAQAARPFLTAVPHVEGAFVADGTFGKLLESLAAANDNRVIEYAERSSHTYHELAYVACGELWMTVLECLEESKLEFSRETDSHGQHIPVVSSELMNAISSDLAARIAAEVTPIPFDNLVCQVKAECVRWRRNSEKPDNGNGDGQGENSTIDHSDDFRSINWFGKTYTFTEKQAACVKVLFDAYQRGTPAVGQQALLEAAESCANDSRLRSLFSRSEAWGTLIVPGDKRGTYQLAAPKI